jgi:hypothetical protein
LRISRNNPEPAGSPEGSSETQVLEQLAPAVTWWPRWFRKHLTPNMAIGAVVVIFSAGTLWSNFRTSKDVKDAQRDVRELRAEFNRKLDGIGQHSTKADVLEESQRNLGDRVKRLEEDYDYAAHEASTPPYPRRAPGRRAK